MKDWKLSEQYAIVALNGLESLHASMAKDAVLRGIAAAKVLEPYIGEEDSVFLTKLEEAVERAKSIKKKEKKELEEEMTAVLKAEGVLEIVPDLLGCDMDYYTSGVELKAYRSEESIYLRIREGLRAEILEEGEISRECALLGCDMDYYTSGVELKAYRSEESIYLRIREGLRAEILEEGEISRECALLLWLFRESGCIHDLFSVEEQNKVQQRMLDMAAQEPIVQELWQSEFYSAVEKFVEKFLRTKRNLFKNPYLQGVNLVFPFLERRSAIFIDFVVFGTDVKSRRIAVMEHLVSFGHYVEEVKLGSETLLKIDNAYYRIVPGTRTAYKVPIQGASLVPVYW